jgi:protein arginine kinase
MKLTEISGNLNEWFSGSGPMSDVVISSRIRLARNLAGYKFLGGCTDAERGEILKRLKEILLGLDLGDRMFYVCVHRAPKLDRNFLVERHLISRHHAFGKGPRGAVVARREFFTAMINEEDHLRMQVIRGGCQLRRCAEQIERIDDTMGGRIDYAFDPRLGYLTACPTNLGTAIRVSVMLHMPALKMTGQIERFFNACRDMNLAVRGLFGEGSEAAGDFYQVSNQVTLGVSEADIVNRFEDLVIPEIVEYETEARNFLLADRINVLDDKISRALALLKNARLISSQEALFLLSHLRLGVNMRRRMGAESPAIRRLSGLGRCGGDKEGLSISMINKLFLLTLPAHLQLNHGGRLDSAGRDALRAKIIRSTLSS